MVGAAGARESSCVYGLTPNQHFPGETPDVSNGRCVDTACMPCFPKGQVLPNRDCLNWVRLCGAGTCDLDIGVCGLPAAAAVLQEQGMLGAVREPSGNRSRSGSQPSRRSPIHQPGRQWRHLANEAYTDERDNVWTGRDSTMLRDCSPFATDAVDFSYGRSVSRSGW